MMIDMRQFRQSNFKVQWGSWDNNPGLSESKTNDLCITSDEFCGGSDGRGETYTRSGEWLGFGWAKKSQGCNLVGSRLGSLWSLLMI